MVEIARQTGARLGLQAPHPGTVVATVPHWHMYGLEASLMLPLQYGMALCAERPLFAEDVRASLERVPEPRLLITTPLHLRACVSGSAMPSGIETVISATAPLALELAQQAETALKTQLFEIYGFTEVGSLAMRRSAVSEVWRVLEGAELFEEGGRCMVRASYLAHTVPVPDRVLLHNPFELSLLGRDEDLVNIAGRRTSLGELNHKLNQIEGVTDGVFFLPEEQATSTSRLIAFVVAPDRSVEQVLASLRAMVDPLFIPRPLYRVDRLPRNETGKLTQEALSQLAERCRREDGANALGAARALPE
jgi:acyl-coenzyme A synthetase/AMP-(fatty) acid ligase